MHFAQEWHLLIGTTNAAVTFFMIFVLARAQVKDTMAIQIKLNEIIGVLKGANNQLINIEGLSESKIAELSKRYETVAEHIHNQSEHAASVGAIVAHEIVEEIAAEIADLANEKSSYTRDLQAAAAAGLRVALYCFHK